MDKSKYFFVGGFFSIAVYTGLLTLIYIVLSDFDTMKKIALKSEQSAVTVSLSEQTNDTPAQPTQTNEPTKNAPQKPMPQPQPMPVPQKQIQTHPIQIKSQPTPKPVQQTVKTVHQTTKADSIDPKKLVKDILKKESKQSASASSSAAAQKNQSQKQQTSSAPKSAKDLLASLSIRKNSDVSFTSFDSSGESNTYLSGIAKLIKQHWNPQKNDAGSSAVVRMDIDASGNFTFHIKRGSNADFNARLTDYLHTLQSRGLPAPSDGKSVSVEFNFKARE